MLNIKIIEKFKIKMLTRNIITGFQFIKKKPITDTKKDNKYFKNNVTNLKLV